MAQERFSKLAELYDRLGYETVATDMRRTCGLPVMTVDQVNERTAQMGGPNPLRSPYHPVPPKSGEDLLTGPRLTKMHEKHQAVPSALQRMIQVDQKKGPVQQVAPVPQSRYLMDPYFGGQDGYPLSSGHSVFRADIPKTKEETPEGEFVDGPYTEDESQWNMSSISPDGFVGPLTDETDINEFVDIYKQRVDQFEGEMTEASKTFNARMKDWIGDAGGTNIAALLSQNFWSTFDKTIYGGSDGVMPETPDGRNIIAAIEHRINAIVDIKAGVDARKSAQGDQLKERVLSMQTDALASLTPQLWASNAECYLRTLSYVYSGDWDLVMINPLKIEYPDELSQMFDSYKATGPSNANIPTTMDEWIIKNTKAGRPEMGVDPKDMLRQKWSLIDVDPEALHRAAWMRKQMRDVSHFKGLTSPKTNFEVPMPTAQLHHIGDYGEELNLLGALKEALLRMVDIKTQSGLEKSSWEQVAKQPELVKTMDTAVEEVLTRAGSLYGSDRFVTQDNRMNAAFDVGEATKMEIFGKILYLAQAWKAFLAHRMPELDEMGLDPNELGMGVRSQIVAGFLRLACMADAIGDHGFADAIDASIAV